MELEVATEILNFDEFYTQYGVKRNPLYTNSLYQNTMIEFDDNGEDLVLEEDQKNVWTLMEDNTKSGKGFFLSPGVTFTRQVIGFFICKIKWKDEKGYILE